MPLGPLLLRRARTELLVWRSWSNNGCSNASAYFRSKKLVHLHLPTCSYTGEMRPAGMRNRQKGWGAVLFMSQILKAYRPGSEMGRGGGLFGLCSRRVKIGIYVVSIDLDNPIHHR